MKKIKIILVVIFSIIGILFSIWEPDIVNPDITNSLLSISAILMFLFQFLQKESNFVFIQSKKFLSIFNRDTVSWKSSVKYNYTYTDDVLRKITDIVSNIKDVTILEKDTKTDKVYLKINYLGYTHDITMTLNSCLEYLILDYSTSVSYKDSKQEFDKFINIIDEINKNCMFLTSASYSIDIHFAKSNPFYRFIVRNIDESSKAHFNLNFTDDKTSSIINITNNNLKVNSKNQSYIRKVLNDYGVISNIK